MSTPLSADRILAALKKWGVRYHEHDGWRSHTTNYGPFGPVYGFIVHHTGDDAPDDADENVVYGGRAGLSGPLAHFGGRDDGSVDLLGCHRANHAGGGDPKVMDAVIAESYGDYPPATHYHQGSAGAVDGNTHFYGLETYYSGSHKPEQYASMVRLVAAILDAHGWSAKSVIAHKEWSDQKWDPGQIDMRVFRADVQKLLDAGPGSPTPTVGHPSTVNAVPSPIGALDMALTEDQLYALMAKAAKAAAPTPEQIKAAAREAVVDFVKRERWVGMNRDADGNVIPDGFWTVFHFFDWVGRILLDFRDKNFAELAKNDELMKAQLVAMADKVGVSADDLVKIAQAVNDAFDARVKATQVSMEVAQ